jgi:hypothetical protein
MVRDFTRIEDVIAAIYSSLSGPAGGRDWSEHEEIFHPDARLMRTGVDENGVSWIKIMTPAEYRDNVALFFSKAPFYEIERERRIEQFGNIATVWSTYVDARDPAGADVQRRGVNAGLLFRGPDGRWRIMALVWDNEREGVRLA